MKKIVLLALIFLFLASLIWGQSGVYISEYSDAGGTGNYVYEFVEIYNNNNSSINISNYVIRQTNSTQSYTMPSNTTIPANGFLILGRDATQVEFEAFWSVTLDANVIYLNSSNVCPLINGSEQYLFEDILGVSVDPPTDDEFSYLVLASGNRVYRLSIGNGASDWTSDDDVNATPGSLDVDQILPVNLSSFYATYIGEIPTLYWTTQSEENNDYWNVYRGTNENFETAAQVNAVPVPGNGTTNYASDYIYVDTEPVVQNSTYWYWIEDVSTDGETVVHEPITLDVPFEDTPNTYEFYGLHQNYPNPFNPSTSISFNLDEDSNVELFIYNVKGEKIKSIFNDHVYADQVNSAIWDGNDSNGKQVSSGVYFYKLITDTKEYQRKMLLVK